MIKQRVLLAADETDMGRPHTEAQVRVYSVQGKTSPLRGDITAGISVDINTYTLYTFCFLFKMLSASVMKYSSHRCYQRLEPSEKRVACVFAAGTHALLSVKTPTDRCETFVFFAFLVLFRHFTICGREMRIRSRGIVQQCAA